MKRNCTIFLLLCLVLGLFGCTVSDEQVQQENNVAQSSDYPDLYEYEFQYLQTGSENDEYFFGYHVSSELAEAAKKRVREVEENLNCVISVEKIDALSTNSAIQLGIAGGTAAWSGVQRWAFGDNNQLGNIRAGYYLPISDFEGILDYKDNAKWGSRDFLLSLCYDGELYGLFPNYWPEYGFMSVDHLFVLNMDLAAEAGVSDPRAMVEQKTWNRSALETLVRDLTIERPEEKVYGLGSWSHLFYEMAFNTAGNTYVVKNSEGEYVSNLLSTDNVETFTWAQDFFVRNKDFISPTRDTYMLVDELCDGKTAMLLMHAYFIFADTADIAYRVENQALLPFPLADGDTSQKWVGQYEEVQYSFHIPICAPNGESAAHVLNALYEPLPDFETEEKRIAYYERTLFHDTRDCTLMMQLLDNMRYTFIYVGNGGGNKNGVRQIVTEISRQSGSMISSLQSHQRVFETSYMPAIADMLETADKLFGE